MTKTKALGKGLHFHQHTLASNFPRGDLFGIFVTPAANAVLRLKPSNLKSFGHQISGEAQILNHRARPETQLDSPHGCALAAK